MRERGISGVRGSERDIRIRRKIKEDEEEEWERRRRIEK
jgi:hypothetical protein